jgi:orotate phosphoribosyltransferase
VARHYESFRLEPLKLRPERVILIDDVVTKGRTLLAAAARVREAFPDAQIRAFALLRTRGLIPDLRNVLEPCRGQILWMAGDAHRIP